MPKANKLISILFFLLSASTFSVAQVPLNWTIDEVNPGEDIVLSADESVFTEGVKSCHLQLKSGAVPYLISNIFYILPGSDYEFSMDVYDNDTAGQVKVYADFYDTYGFNIFGEPPLFSADSGEWQTISWQGTVPDQAIVGYVLVKYYCQPNLYTFTRPADAWIDNIQFRHNGGDNLVENGGFEDWVVGIREGGSYRDQMNIYPNPARDLVNVEVKGLIDFIVISDLAGKEMLRVKGIGTDSHRIDIKPLPAGIYFLSAILTHQTKMSGLFYKF